jgi:hypothetical protein
MEKRMKRTEAVALIFRSIEPYINPEYEAKVIMQVADTVLDNLEKSGMFYCPVEDLGEITLRTPKGFEMEETLSPAEAEKISKYIEEEIVLLTKLQEEGD